MAALATPIQDPKAGNELINLITAIAPQFGSGTTTSESSTSADPAAMAQSNELLASIMGNNNSKYLDDLVQNILTQAKSAFGPNISASLGAGNRALTDTTLANAQSLATASATAQAAAAKLSAITNNNNIAANLVNNQLNATKKTTQTSKTSASPAGQGLSLVSGGLAAKSLLDKLKKGTSTASAVGGASASSGALGSGGLSDELSAGGSVFDNSGNLLGATPDISISPALDFGGESALSVIPSFDTSAFSGSALEELSFAGATEAATGFGEVASLASDFDSLGFIGGAEELFAGMGAEAAGGFLDFTDLSSFFDFGSEDFLATALEFLFL